MNILNLDIRVVKLSKASIVGESTFGMKDTEGDEYEELQIKDASKSIDKILNILNGKNDVDLLHVNCEVRKKRFDLNMFCFIKTLIFLFRAVNGKCLRIL